MSASKPSRKPSSQSKASRQPPPSAFERAVGDLRQPTHHEYPNVSPRWLLGAAIVVLLAAAVFAWLCLCLLYWQGSWQLLYHPQAAITRTPASVGLTFNTIPFAVTETGQPQLSGWWMPAPLIRPDPALPPPKPHLTVLYLHGADGNIGDCVDLLPIFRNDNLASFAFDYRGYGQSQTIAEAGRPSEKHFRQDAEWALHWLIAERSIPANRIVIYGADLGANLAAELAADHPEVAGVILDQPLQDPVAPVFNDRRSRLVPAHWLVSDRYDLTAAARAIKIPSLWFIAQHENGAPASQPVAYQSVGPAKTSVTLRPPFAKDPNYSPALKRWLDDLP